MAVKTNTLDGADGVTITAANSALPDAFGTPTIGASCTLTYSVTQAKSGTASMAITEPVTYAATHVPWAGLGLAAGVDLWSRFYVYPPAIAAQGMAVYATMTAAVGTNCRLRANATTGFMTFTNAAGTEITACTGTVAISINQWIRIETRVRASTTAGEVEWWLYNSPDSTTESDHGSATSQVLGADLDMARFGFTAPSGPASVTWYFDEFAVSTDGKIGPLGAAGVAVMGPAFTAIPFMK